MYTNLVLIVRQDVIDSIDGLLGYGYKETIFVTEKIFQIFHFE